MKRSVLLAVPHPAEIMRTLKSSPKHIIRSFHWFLFQLPGLPELLINARKGKFLNWLWCIWSPNFNDEKHVKHITDSMLQGSSVKDTLAYYRAALQVKFREPALVNVWNRLNDPIIVPTKVLCGKQDMRKEMLPRQTDKFTSDANYNFQLVDNAGHFLHREQPEVVNKAISEWLQY